MTGHPVLVRNEGVPGTDIRQSAGGRLVARLGAEGLVCIAVLDRSLKLAIAGESGTMPGLEPAAIAWLDPLKLADDAMLGTLRERNAGLVMSFRREPAGAIVPRLTFQLTRSVPPSECFRPTCGGQRARHRGARDGSRGAWGRRWQAGYDRKHRHRSGISSENGIWSSSSGNGRGNGPAGPSWASSSWPPSSACLAAVH